MVSVTAAKSGLRALHHLCEPYACCRLPIWMRNCRQCPPIQGWSLSQYCSRVEKPLLQMNDQLDVAALLRGVVQIHIDKWHTIKADLGHARHKAEVRGHSSREGCTAQTSFVSIAGSAAVRQTFAGGCGGQPPLSVSYFNWLAKMAYRYGRFSTTVPCVCSSQGGLVTFVDTATITTHGNCETYCCTI